PDWIAEVWERDLGAADALALMRAQNEPPETVVRALRGDPRGEPTDIPGAYRVERIDEDALAAGKIWPQSRGSQLAGLVARAQPARGAVARAVARVAARRCRTDETRRHDRVLRLHDECRRERSGRRGVGAHRCAARRRMAAVRSSATPRVLADAAARAPNER